MHHQSKTFQPIIELLRVSKIFTLHWFYRKLFILRKKAITKRKKEEK